MINKKELMSRRLIQGALVELLRTKSFELITITELCRVANINRTTFYNLYSSQRDVLDEIIKKYVDVSKNGITNNDLYLYFKTVLSHAIKNRDELIVLLDKLPINDFIKKITNIDEVDEKINNHISDKYNKKERKYLLESYKTATFTLINTWIHDNNRVEINDLINLINQIYKGVVFKKGLF